MEGTQLLISNVFRGIRFTMETGNSNQLAFLEIIVTAQNSASLRTSVYRKESHIDQFLISNSNRPKCHKMSCIRMLSNRVHIHRDTGDSQKKEGNQLMLTFHRNDYPRIFIRRCVLGNRNKEQSPVLGTRCPELTLGHNNTTTVII